MAANGARRTDFKVLVTGFGANKSGPYGNTTSNPAGTIAQMMPISLAGTDTLNASDLDIDILDGGKEGWTAIPGQLGVIRQTMKTLHEQYGDSVDLWIHLGRGPWEHVTCERRAFRQDFTSSWLTEEEHKGYYTGRDNVQQNADDLGPCPWMDVPMGLHSEIDINRIVIDANAALSNVGNKIEIKSHLEAGPSGCGFIYYESMANCFAKGRKRNILFVHVPRHEEEHSLRKAKDAVLAIIGASAASICSKPPENKEQELKEPASWKVRFGDEL